MFLFVMLIITLRVCSEVTTSFWQYGVLGVGGYYTQQYQDLSDVSSAIGTDFAGYSSAGWIHQFTVSYNPCLPSISVPPELYNINSVWASCGNSLKGLFDPPHTLTPGSGLHGVATTAPVPVLPPSTSAVAGPSPTPVTPVATSTVSVDPIPTTPSTPVAQPSPTTPNSKDGLPAATSYGPSIDPEASNSPSQPSPTQPGSPTAVQPQITVGGSTITASSSSLYIIGSQTLKPASQITLSNTVYSLASNGGTLIIGGSSTQVIATSVQGQSPSITIGGSIVIADLNSHYIIGSQTLGPAAQITNSGIVYSLASNGGSLTVGGTTTQVINMAPLPTPAALPSSITIANSVGTNYLFRNSLLAGSQRKLPSHRRHHYSNYRYSHFRKRYCSHSRRPNTFRRWSRAHYLWNHNLVPYGRLLHRHKQDHTTPRFDTSFHDSSFHYSRISYPGSRGIGNHRFGTGCKFAEWRG